MLLLDQGHEEPEAGEFLKEEISAKPGRSKRSRSKTVKWLRIFKYKHIPNESDDPYVPKAVS